MKPRILVVDDEKNIRRTLTMILRSAGYQVREAASGEEGIARLAEGPSDVVLLDVNLPGQDGLETLRQIKSGAGSPEVIMISGQATVTTAVEATREGAFDFLEKPLSKERVLIAVRNATEVSSLGDELGRFRASEAKRYTMVGDSPAIEALRKQIATVAPTAATVLVTGESGCGKELVARAIHEASPRAGGPFVKVNCAAIPDTLIEAELFGAVKGAYTGADRTRDGKFLQADGGTIFLDEIGDMRLEVQAKVLRVLQEGEVERIGDSATHRVDVRVVAATNKDLEAEASAGRFREDLYYRLAVVPLRVVPLRERPDDIARLAQHFLELYAVENDLPPRTLTEGALRLLSGMSWRGNVRELKNVIDRLAIFAAGPSIGEEDVLAFAPKVGSAPPGGGTGASGDTGTAATVTTDATAVPPAADAGTGSATASLPDPSRASDGFPVPSLEMVRELGGLVEARRGFESRIIEACLDATDGNVSQAARWLSIERTNLHKKLQSLGIEARPGRKRTEEDPS